MYLFKSDMIRINWDEAEEKWELFSKDWDITNMNIRCPSSEDSSSEDSSSEGSSGEDSSHEDSSSEDSNTRSDDLDTSSEIREKHKKILDLTRQFWNVISDLKDAIFYMDLARDYSVSYSPVVASELGGFIHIRGEMGKTIYSYNVKDNTISLSSIPSPMLPTSHVSMWECRYCLSTDFCVCIPYYTFTLSHFVSIFSFWVNLSD